jgi:hypothetical protein
VGTKGSGKGGQAGAASGGTTPKDFGDRAQQDTTRSIQQKVPPAPSATYDPGSMLSPFPTFHTMPPPYMPSPYDRDARVTYVDQERRLAQAEHLVISQQVQINDALARILNLEREQHRLRNEALGSIQNNKLNRPPPGRGGRGR